jgi:hypothetical protein
VTVGGSALPTRTGRAFRVRLHCPRRCAAHRRTRRNARAQRYGRWRRARRGEDALSVRDPTSRRLAEPHRPRGLDERFASAFVAAAPLIDERAATLGTAQIAEEHAGVTKLSVKLQLCGSRGATPPDGTGRAFHARTRPPSSPCIGERAATRGHSAVDRGDGLAAVKGVIRSRSCLANRTESCIRFYVYYEE